MAKRPTTAASNNNAHGHAAPSAATSTASSSMDYAAHEATYRRFTDMVKWGIIACVVLVIFLFIAIHPMVQTPAS